MNTIVILLLITVGLINLAPIVGLLGFERLESAYKINLGSNRPSDFNAA